MSTIYIVVAEGETDHHGILRAFEDKQLAWEYMNIEGCDMYDSQDLDIIETKLV